MHKRSASERAATGGNYADDPAVPQCNYADDLSDSRTVAVLTSSRKPAENSARIFSRSSSAVLFIQVSAAVREGRPAQ